MHHVVVGGEENYHVGLCKKNAIEVDSKQCFIPDICDMLG